MVFFHFRVESDKAIHKASKTVPFYLANEDAFIRVTDPEEASGLELTSFYDKFYPANETLFQSLSGWLHGAKTKGHQNIELILQEGQAVTGVGELRLRNNEVSLCPPSQDRRYMLSTSFVANSRAITKELETSIAKSKTLSMCSLILSTACLVAHALLNFYWFYVIFGVALLLVPRAVLHASLKCEHKMRAKMRGALNRRIRDVEDQVSDDDDVETSSSTSDKDDSEEEDDKNVCVVCMCVPRDCVLIDCGHVCVCQDCAEELNPYQCPICRKRIRQVMPIYHA